MIQVLAAWLMADCAAEGSRRDEDPNFEPVFVRGEGSYLWDDTGKRYLDCVSGYSSTLFGHAYPPLVYAAREQLATLTQLVGLQHSWRNRLECELAKRTESLLKGQAKVWLVTTGARAVEVAWKIAYAFRPGNLLRFDSAYHGRSLATALLSDTKQLPIVKVTQENPLTYPRCDACPIGKSPETCCAECFDQDQKWLAQHHARISAVLVEPALGARGYYFAPPVFFHRLREATARFGILLIDDEIQMGLGRLGSFYAAERQGWSPDLVLLGKSLGGGIVPIAATVGRRQVMDCLPPGYESETFAANPLACGVALAAIKELDTVIPGSEWIEATMRRCLHELQLRSPFAIKVANMGAAGIVQTTPGNAAMVARGCHDEGLLVHWSGVQRDRIVFIPPLIIKPVEIDQAFGILARVLQTVSSTL